MANLTATISAGTSLSGPVLLSTSNLLAIQIPASWTDAVLTFTSSIDGVDFAPIHRGGNEVRQPVTADTVARLNPHDFSGATQIQIRSGTEDNSVNQISTVALVLLTQ